jgi:type III restriction enzyme
MKGQFIFRYGATFPESTETIKNFRGDKEKIVVKDYNNLVYQLTAVDSFNRNLVKGVIAHITEFEEGKNAIIRLLNSDTNEATFELDENKSKKTYKIGKKDSLGKIHNELSDLFLENCNKTTVVLSNGLELKKSDKINPYSYAQTIQESMLQKAIYNHFKIEKELLTKDTKIKPLTLFFIDNIDEYRNENGYLKITTEKLIINEINNLLETEENPFYKNYLVKTLENISLTHGGYFSKDNSDKDEAIEKEINEILHDKQAILDLENPRRFIFSKWTLREGWDNPNVFQICKLRSSGSEISKLQEVGRGLRLPVNEFGNRVKDQQFFLNYFVDFTESDFVNSLINEINEKSGAFSVDIIPEKLTDNMIKQICDAYNLTEGQLLEQLDENNVITRTNNFKEGGFDYIKLKFPLIFVGVNTNKIRKVEETKKKITIRKSKYPELKALWEKLNEKVILEYKFDNEELFKELFIQYLKQAKSFKVSGIQNRTETLAIQNNQAYLKEETTIYSTNNLKIITMTYSDFLKELAKRISININTLHNAFIVTKSLKDINEYLNQTTINIIKQEFDYYLLINAIDKFSIEYKNISNSIHPTKLTNKKGEVLNEIMASDIGIIPSDEKVAENYLFNELYFDSELEKDNIVNKIKEVIVFTKIPKNSIKIPVSGGKTYSPDFAYVIEFENGTKKLNFIVETKNVTNENTLRSEEISKIKHAEKYFGNTFEVKFRTQFSNDKIYNMINEIITNSCTQY